MFKNTFQSGFISVLYAGGSKPLEIWASFVKNGHIRRITDEDVQTLVLDLGGTNVATTYIVCPPDKRVMGIRLPYFVMIVKNMKKYFTFEITILDDKRMSRRFRVSNYQSTTRVRPFSTSLPIGLTGGWNQIQFNLADFTRRAYGSSYIETLRVQIHANVRVRRIYFSDRLYSEEEMPHEFKLYVPITSQKSKPTKIDQKGKIPVEDKATGADKHRLSEVKPEPAEVPAGLPTPTGSVHDQEIKEEPAKEEPPAEVAAEVPAESMVEGQEASPQYMMYEEEMGEHGYYGGEEMLEYEEDYPVSEATEAPTEASTDITETATEEAPSEASPDEAPAAEAETPAAEGEAPAPEAAEAAPEAEAPAPELEAEPA